jgi:uncharacterized delta-60 repeat protein
MKPLFYSCLFAALLSAGPAPAQHSRADESSRASMSVAAQTREQEQLPHPLKRKLLGGLEPQHFEGEHRDDVAARPEPRLPFVELQPGAMEMRAGLAPGFAGPKTLAPSAFGSAREAWVRHYGGGLAPSHDDAVAMTVDAASNVYVTGHSSGQPFGMDYLTVKYDPTGKEVWTARYDGPDHGDDFALAIAVDGAGNVYVTGYSFSASGYYDYATAKYNGAGVQQWVQRYNGPQNSAEVAYDIAVDAAGNVYVTGYGYASGSSYDYLTIKYDGAGAQQWLQSYDGVGRSSDYATALQVDANGNVYVTGRSYGSGSSYDYATLKYNSAGTQQWVQRYNGAGNGYDYALALAVDAAGNVYVTGYSVGAGTAEDYATVKYNGAGVEQWVQSYNGPGNSYDVASAIAVDAAGNVYVTGYTYSSGSSYDYATIKYNSSGAQQWAQSYNGPGNRSDYALKIGIDATGNVCIAGYSYGSGTSYDYAAIKYNDAGVEQWVQRYNGPASSYDYLYALRLDAAGNVYVTGYSYSSSSGDDYATIKYNSAGVKQWEARYDGPGGAYGVATALSCDAAGNVYVTGYTQTAITGYDYATIKYDSAGVEQWTQRYNSSGSSSDYAYAIAVDAAGNVYVTGSTGTVKYNSAGAQQWAVAGSGVAIAVDGAGNAYVTGTFYRSGSLYDYRTVKYNSAGVTQWNIYYNGPANDYDYAVALALDAASNVYVTGYSRSGASDYDYATIKYNSAGVEQWVQRYNQAAADSNDYAFALAVAPASGEVYVTGSSYGGGTSYDYATIKYNSAGVEQWVQRATTLGAYRDEAYYVAVDAIGNVYVGGTSGVIKYDNAGAQKWATSDNVLSLALDVAGSVYVASQTYASSSYDFVITKYDGAGRKEWSKTYSGPGSDEPTALRVDAAGNVYVTGYSYGHSWYAYTTVKYTQDTPPVLLKLQAPSSQLPGAEFWVDIHIDSVQNLFGASFDLDYTNTSFIDAVTPYSGNVIAGPFLGNDVVFFANVDETAGKVSIGISRKAGQNGVSGSGVLARVKFKSLASTPLNTQVLFSFSNVKANDPSGNTITLTPATLTVTISGIIVWPGDTNNDGKVDAADVLPLGLNWTKTGSARQNGSCNWAGQPAIPWTPVQATYADANGDGKVDAADVLCIGLNWGKTHSTTSLAIRKTNLASAQLQANAGTLCYTITGNPSPGQEFYVDVLAMNVTTLFGVSFELVYSPTADFDPQTAEAGSFMGSNVLFFPNIDKSTGKISIGISQKAPQSGVTGSGVVARIKMKMSASAPAGQVINLTLQNVVATDPAGGSLEITSSGNCTTTGVEEFTRFESAPSAFALYAPSPNPFNPSTTLRYDLPQQVEVKFMVFDMLGRQVRTLVNQTQPAGRYAVIWDGRNEQGQPVASGTFLYRLHAGNFVKTLRMALVR